jgi:hypothetical protein
MSYAGLHGGGGGSSTVITGVAPTDAALGPELITNGTFTTDLSSWTVGANWAWSAATALHTAGATATIAQNISVITGEEYLVQYSITGAIAGLLAVSVDGVTITSYNTIETDVPGSYYATFVATSTGSVPLTFTPTSAFNAALDSVSVKRVTPTANAIFTIRDSAASAIAVFRGSGALHNLGIGLDSLKNNTSGYDNVGVGRNVLSKNVTGFENVAFGSSALAANGAGYADTAIGFNSLLSNTSGFSNTAVGADTLRSNTGGAYNTVLGHGSMYKNTLGFSNIAIGLNALYENLTGNYSIAIGSNALGKSLLGQNISIGIDSMPDNTTGIYNIALGQYALFKNTIGSNNCAYGIQSMYENTDGLDNTAYGYQSLNSSVSADNVTAIGSQALGYQTAGDNNVAVGFFAGVTETLLNRNLTGANNTWIGTESGPGNTTQLTNSIAVGYRSHPTASNMAHWGNSSITQNYMYGALNLPSYTTKRVLYIGTSGLVSENSKFLFDPLSGREELILGPYDLNLSYTRALMSWGYTDTTVGFQPPPPTSLSAVINTGDGQGNWSTTIYYKIYSYITINGQRLYSQTPGTVTIPYTTTDSGTITFTAAAGVDGYRVWVSTDNVIWTQAADADASPFNDNSGDIVYEADDIESGNPDMPTWEHRYTTYIGGANGRNMFSVYGGSGYFYRLGVNKDPLYKLDIQEDSLSTIAARIVRDGSTSLNDEAFQVVNLSGSASAGATIESGGPNQFGTLRMAGTRVSTSDYLGVFEFQDKASSGDKRVGMIIGKAGTASARGSMEFLTRNAASFQTSLSLTEDGYVGVGGIAATARLHLPAGTATANTAPLKFTSGIDLTAPVAGAMEFDGTRLSFSPSTTRKRIQLSDDVAPTNGQLMIGNGTDFTVASLTAGANITLTPGAGSLTIAASGGGSGNSVTTTLAFGASFTDKAQTVVTGQAWVTSTSEIVAQVRTPAGVDPDEMRLLDFEISISDFVVGTGFTVTLYSEPEARNDYEVMCIGV